MADAVSREAVVITGAGVVSPAGLGLGAHFAGLVRGISQVRDVSFCIFSEGVKAPVGAPVNVSTPKGQDRHVHLAQLAAGEALEKT